MTWLYFSFFLMCIATAIQNKNKTKLTLLREAQRDTPFYALAKS